jgi:outer membrane protein TolC
MGVENPPECLAEPDEMIFENAPSEKYLSDAFSFRDDLKQAQFLLQAAESEVKAQQADFIPSFFVEGNYVHGDTDQLFYGDKNDWDVALKASYPLFTGFSNTADVEKAKSRLAEASAYLNRLKREIQVEVLTVYSDILTQQKVIKSIKDQVLASTANYEQITAQFNEGLASAVDVVDAQTALNESEQQLANAYYRLQIDQLRLKLATGILGRNIIKSNEQDS